MLSRALQLHPQCLDFWLIGAYTELDLKGNLFNGRKLILSAIRTNQTNPRFYVEYFRFEIKFYEKVKTRIEVLNGKAGETKQIEFIDHDEEDRE